MLQTTAREFKTLEYHALQPSIPPGHMFALLPETHDTENQIENAPANPAEAASLRDQVAVLEAKLAESEQTLATRVKEAHQLGYDAACADAEAQSATQMRSRLDQIGVALSQLAEERNAYFGRVEREVVKLALAIATRILHRESRMDPLLLSGAVRVALERIREGTDCTLRVAVAEAQHWQDWLTQVPQPSIKLAINPDSALASGDCRLETQHGRLDLGVQAQLVEIERGFFDLLEQRSNQFQGASKQ